MSVPSVKFNKQDRPEFFRELRSRVNQYFQEKNLSRHADLNMKFKTVFMLCLYLTPLVLMLTGVVASLWPVILMWAIMGLGMSGIGLSVMHDANHGAYSKKESVNRYLGKIIHIVGGYAPNWQIQHNVLHHTYTNVHGYDEDIMPPKFLRFSPNEKRKYVHRFQHIYAWFFYGLMTVSWITAKDFQQLFRFKKMGLTKSINSNFSALFTELLVAKIMYYIFMLVLPLLLIDIAWYWIPIFLFMLHFICGLTLALVFQPAHVISDVDFVKADESLSIDESFAIHQMRTTANFAPRSNILYWLIGGLNYQVEHHLFPNICHVHYKKLSKIVRQTAEEFGVPYHTHATFFGALKYHTKMLKSLGRA